MSSQDDLVGVDPDILGGLPVSVDSTQRQREVDNLLRLLGDVVPEDPAVAAVLRRIRAALDLLRDGTSAADSDGRDLSINIGVDASESLQLARFKEDFDRGIRLIKKDGTVEAKPNNLTWEKVERRLKEKNALNPQKTNLEMALDLQGGGELFGVDEDGKLLIKDRGTEPVMFGFDKNKQPVTVYNRDAGGIASLKEGRVANYWEVYEAVCGPENMLTGYELFPNTLDFKIEGMIAAVEGITKSNFVRSATGDTSVNGYRSSWVDGGRDAQRQLKVAPYVAMWVESNQTYLSSTQPKEILIERGAIRFFRA